MSLRFPRPVIVAAAIGLAAAWAALGSGTARAEQVRHGEWWLGALHVTNAQKITEGAGVTIALLDTGVDPAQPDITGSVISGPDYTHAGEAPGSQFFGIHGTAMASLIVGHGHGSGQADGIVGVAPAAKLLSVRVTLDGGDPLLADSAIVAGLPGAIAQGIRYAVRNGAQVIDLPLDPGQSPSDLVASTAPPPAKGTPPTPAEAAELTAAGGSAAEQSAVAYALRKGVVLVAPGGDNGTGTDDPNFPADYPGVISVGAFNSSFVKAPFTSHQSYVTLTAAGSGMTAAIPTGYTTVSSTSAASAIVTGIAALIRSQYPQLTPAQVTDALTSSTVFRPPNGMTDGSGHGTVDAAAALAAAKKIAGSGPRRAGAGAVSRAQPTAPPVPFIDQALAPKIERDALISAALLLVLLIPVTAYGMVRLRRRQDARDRQVAARPEPELPERTPYATSNGDSRADQMLQYFTAAAPQPESARAPRNGGSAATHTPVRGSSYARGTGNFGGTFGDSGAPGDDAHRAGQPARLPVVPARRAHIRPPRVSGSPPWEPAPKPETELPWAGSPSALPRRAPVPMPAPPAPAAPLAEASEAIWGTAELPRVPPDAVAAPGAPETAGAAGAPEGEAAASPDVRPIFVWNPANTDTFPSVPSVRRPDEDAGQPPPDD